MSGRQLPTGVLRPAAARLEVPAQPPDHPFGPGCLACLGVGGRLAALALPPLQQPRLTLDSTSTCPGLVDKLGDPNTNLALSANCPAANLFRLLLHPSCFEATCRRLGCSRPRHRLTIVNCLVSAPKDGEPSAQSPRIPESTKPRIHETPHPLLLGTSQTTTFTGHRTTCLPLHYRHDLVGRAGRIAAHFTARASRAPALESRQVLTPGGR